MVDKRGVLNVGFEKIVTLQRSHLVTFVTTTIATDSIAAREFEWGVNAVGAMDVSVKTERSGVLARTQSPAATTARFVAFRYRRTVVATGDCVRLRSLRFAPTLIHRPYSA
jgi:hypothetical protein